MPPVPGAPGPDEARLVVGLVRGVHGLRGAVRVEVLTDDAGRFEVGSVLHPEGTVDRLTVAWVQADGPGLLVRFRELGDRESAEALRDRYLEAVRLEPLPEGSFYWHEVEGAEVVAGDGEPLGHVRDVFRAGGGEVYVVRGGPRGEVLVPAVRGIVLEMAPREGRIVVDREALGLDEEPPTRRPRGRRTTRALRSGSTVAARASDAAPDVPPGPSPDVSPDAAPDVPPDAAPDVPPGPSPDAVPDVSTDAAPDVSPDAAPDDGPGAAAELAPGGAAGVQPVPGSEPIDPEP